MKALDRINAMVDGARALVAGGRVVAYGPSPDGSGLYYHACIETECELASSFGTTSRDLEWARNRAKFHAEVHNGYDPDRRWRVIYHVVGS